MSNDYESPTTFFESRYARPIERLINSEEISEELGRAATDWLQSTLPFHKVSPLVYAQEESIRILWTLNDADTTISGVIEWDDEAGEFCVCTLHVKNRGEVLASGEFFNNRESAKQIFYKFLKNEMHQPKKETIQRVNPQLLNESQPRDFNELS